MDKKRLYIDFTFCRLYRPAASTATIPAAPRRRCMEVLPVRASLRRRGSALCGFCSGRACWIRSRSGADEESCRYGGTGNQSPCTGTGRSEAGEKGGGERWTENCQGDNLDTLFFMSWTQARALADLIVSDCKDKSQYKEAIKLAPAADMVLFGRMVASDPSLNYDAAAQVAHAISTMPCRPNMITSQQWMTVRRRILRVRDISALSSSIPPPSTGTRRSMQWNWRTIWTHRGRLPLSVRLRKLSSAPCPPANRTRSQTAPCRMPFTLLSGAISGKSLRRFRESGSCFPEWLCGAIETEIDRLREAGLSVLYRGASGCLYRGNGAGRPGSCYAAE